MADLRQRDQWKRVMAALRGISGHHGIATSSNGSEHRLRGHARFFFFERCQTTPGKPFSGTSGSPV